MCARRATSDGVRGCVAVYHLDTIRWNSCLGAGRAESAELHPPSETTQTRGAVTSPTAECHQPHGSGRLVRNEADNYRERAGEAACAFRGPFEFERHVSIAARSWPGTRIAIAA